MMALDDGSPMKAGGALCKRCVDLIDGLNPGQPLIVLNAHGMHLHVPHSVKVEVL